MFKFSTKRIARAGIVGALYVALTFAVFPIASGAIQFRASEMLTVLPVFFPETVFGLFVGCMISNLVTGAAVYDVIFGSLITLVAGMLSYYLGRIVRNTVLKIIVVGFFPVAMNAFLLPVIWFYAYGELEFVYMLQVAYLLASQGAVIYGLGTVLFLAVKNLKEKGVYIFTDEKRSDKKQNPEKQQDANE